MYPILELQTKPETKEWLILQIYECIVVKLSLFYRSFVTLNSLNPLIYSFGFINLQVSFRISIFLVFFFTTLRFCWKHSPLEVDKTVLFSKGHSQVLQKIKKNNVFVSWTGCFFSIYQHLLLISLSKMLIVYFFLFYIFACLVYP